MLSLFRLLVVISLACCNIYANNQEKIIVKAVTVKSSKLFDKFTATGQCFDELNRSYYANSEGIVDYISDKEGRKVAKGDLILAIDKKIADSTKDQAISNLEVANLNYKRTQALFDKGYMSKQAFEKIKVDYKDAILALERANKQYEDLVIKAAFSGVVSVIKIKLGSKVNVGDYLFDLTADGDKSLLLEVPENLYHQINIDDVLSLSDSNGNSSTGMITAIAKNLSSSGTLDVRARIAQDNNFIDGSYLNAEFIINIHQGLSVPESTISRNDQGSFIYLINDKNIVKQTYVKLGSRVNDQIEIIAQHLQENDLVVVEGLTKIADGVTVEIQY